MQTAMLIFSGVVALASITTVVITFWYTRLTRRILKEINRPEICITLEFETTYHERRMPGSFRDVSYQTYLLVKNIGTGIARKVRFEGDFSFQPLHSKPLDTIDFLVNDIDILLPGQTAFHRIFDVSGHRGDIFNEDFYKNKRSVVRIDATYEDISGKSYTHKAIKLDFAKSVDPNSYTAR